ncbi:jg988 [Pararge aegeria aegeria]|uniref:Jg988 protein n=1 Tax=Pararge aegeria aegeria TaxID=348720 RepID=A0A8S4QIJ8_9NEOP|nr:jg988 [Pararge aegeria aegeria]
MLFVHGASEGQKENVSSADMKVLSGHLALPELTVAKLSHCCETIVWFFSMLDKGCWFLAPTVNAMVFTVANVKVIGSKIKNISMPTTFATADEASAAVDL